MSVAWIKIVHTMPDKPEVARIAERLGIDLDSVSGKLLRLWIWCDQQTVDGTDIGVTSAFIDRLTNCPGFSAALLEVGWLTDRKGRLSIPRFDRHNGQTAKSRALSSDRMKRARYARSATENDPPLLSLSPSFAGCAALEEAVQDWARYYPNAREGKTFDQIQLTNVLMDAQRREWDATKLAEAIRFSIAKGFKSICDPNEFNNGKPNTGGSKWSMPKLGAKK